MGEAAGQALDRRGINEDGVPLDKAADLQKKWKTKAGQLWHIGTHRLLCGDSTDPRDVMRLMGNERAVLFATDPPYAGGSPPQSWGNQGAANRDNDWSGKYVEAKSADVQNTEDSGLELYRGFVRMAIAHAITPAESLPPPLSLRQLRHNPLPDARPRVMLLARSVAIPFRAGRDARKAAPKPQVRAEPDSIQLTVVGVMVKFGGNSRPILTVLASIPV
jgi:hypothetical protein